MIFFRIFENMPALQAKWARVLASQTWQNQFINAIPPSWTLILPRSWGKSKTNFKGEVDGFKIEERRGGINKMLLKSYLPSKTIYMYLSWLLDGTFLEPCGNGCNLKILARVNLNQRVLFTKKVNENSLTKF